VKKKTKSGVARQNQATQAGWLEAQGAGEARTSVAETVTALGQRRRLDEAAAVVTGKTEEEKTKNGDGVVFIARPRSKQKPRRSPSPLQCDAKDGHDALGTPKKIVGHVA